MEIFLAVVITFIVTVVAIFFIEYLHLKSQKRDEDLFTFKLQTMLSDTYVPLEKRLEKAMELCRMTKGKMSSGAYWVLSEINEINKQHIK